MTQVIAYATSREGYYDLFMASCKRYKVEPVILGWGEKWIGSGNKLMAICAYLEGLKEDDIVISVDPFDVLFLCGLPEIETKFRNMNIQFLCGALKLGGFNKTVYGLEFNRTNNPTPETPTHYNFLNAGTWISYAGYACRLINYLTKKLKMSEDDTDQEWLTHLYINNKTDIDIDWKCEIFHNLLFKDFITRRPDLKDLIFNKTRVSNSSTGTQPCILHASGNTPLRNIAMKLGYDPKISFPVNDRLNYFKKAIYYLFMLLRYGMLSIVR